MATEDEIFRDVALLRRCLGASFEVASTTRVRVGAQSDPLYLYHRFPRSMVFNLNYIIL